MKKCEILTASLFVAALMFVSSVVFYGGIYVLCSLFLSRFTTVMSVIKYYLIIQTAINTVCAVFKAYSQISAGKTSITC